jgi:hypothetical protein
MRERLLYNKVECNYNTEPCGTFREGHKFKHLFDFGDEWVFQCRVLKALADACPQPLVVRSKGEAPEQYGNPARDAGEEEYDDDEDMSVFPEMYPPQALQKLYDALSIPQQTVQLVRTYFDAMAHLYAVIPLRKALEILQNQGVELTDVEFLTLTKIIRHEKHHYAILGEEEIYPDDPKATPSQPMEREIVEESLYMVGLDEYDEMVAQQQGKPYYIPPREELLRYADEFYYEPTKQTTGLPGLSPPHKRRVQGKSGGNIGRGGFGNRYGLR